VVCTQAPKGTEKGVISYPGIRSRDVLWCAQKRAHPTCWYNSRWYDSSLGRWAQPDTLIPSPGNPMAWDRYAYVLNSPMRFNDPTGHANDEGGGAASMGDEWWEYREERIQYIVNEEKRNAKNSEVAGLLDATAMTLDAAALATGVGGLVVEGLVFDAFILDGIPVDELLAAWFFYSPINTAETVLSGVALGFTTSSDIVSGETDIINNANESGLVIGDDTVFGAFSMIAGLAAQDAVTDTVLNIVTLQDDAMGFTDKRKSWAADLHNEFFAGFDKNENRIRITFRPPIY